ncbi:hypothetical protein [Methylotuvimicrobium sp. KM2]|uniref:hypothetical protein n=1 Tax=Methylotuvimicrobium sp. KM2 TaxID=3133976 RepID=UPI003100B947
MKNNTGSEEGAVARPTGVGGRDSRRRAYMDVFTQHLNSIVHWLWLTILDDLGAGFTASYRASDRIHHSLHFHLPGDCRAFMNVT